MSNPRENLSIVIPTYGRDDVLCDTLALLMKQHPRAKEILVMDQSPGHNANTMARLSCWHSHGDIRHMQLKHPSIPVAMNRGVREAKGKIVLFLDDDIVPDSNLIQKHLEAYQKHPEAWAVVGQVIQPEDEMHDREYGELDEVRDRPQNTQKDTEEEEAGAILKSSESNSRNSIHARLKDFILCILRILRLPFPSPSFLRKDIDFNFSGTDPAWVTNVMAGNLSVRRERFIQLGGFDENFTPPVSFRFETEFAKRLVAAGGRIRFEPAASIRHLRVSSGGTRSSGSHLTSASPVHGVGDYYYALRWGRGMALWWYMCKRPFRQIRTRFHLRHPWYIPIKFTGEIRALLMALRLYRKGTRLMKIDPRDAEA